MGSQWGVNRSVAQVHALLYLSDRPLHAEEICEALGLARSNVSTALKELQAYEIVRRTHVKGDRRDHFVAETDPWDLLMKIAAERKRREIDPTIALLGELAAKLEGRKDVPAACPRADRPDARFIGTLTRWYEDIRRVPKPTLVALMKLGARSPASCPSAAAPAAPN